MKVKLVAAAEVEDVGVVADERTDDAVQAAEVGEQRLCSHTGVIVVDFEWEIQDGARDTIRFARTQSSPHNKHFLKARTPKQLTQVKEVINYRSAIFFGFELIQQQGFLKLKDIETIQKTIIENNAGIRSMAGTVLKNDKTREIVYTPPQEKDEILDLLGNFLKHFNVKQNDLNPLINLAILHYQFESIHPFYDGNGRAGRILNILYLIINDLLDIPILYLSSYINENKADYYVVSPGSILSTIPFASLQRDSNSPPL